MTQSRVVIGLLNGHNTLRRHLYIMGLINSPLCRRCGGNLSPCFECEALASLKTHLLGLLFLDLGDVRSLSLGNLELQYRNRARMAWTSDYGAQRACPKGLGASRLKGLEPIYFSILFYLLTTAQQWFFSLSLLNKAKYSHL
jgi:hypothetical protein